LATIYLLLLIQWSPYLASRRPIRIFSQRSWWFDGNMIHHCPCTCFSTTKDNCCPISSASLTHPPPLLHGPRLVLHEFVRPGSTSNRCSTVAQIHHAKSTVIHRVQQERSCDLSDTTILDDATRGGGHSCSVPGKGEQCCHQPEFPSSSAQGKPLI
jgi:hypothetical protein